MLILKFVICLSSAFMILFGFPHYMSAQGTEITESEITIKQMRLPVLPSKSDTSKHSTIEDEVAIVIANVVEELKVYDVIVGINLTSISKDQAFQKNGKISDSLVVNLEEITDDREAIVLTVLNFSQNGIPPAEDEKTGDEPFFERAGSCLIEFSTLFHIFKRSADESQQGYPNNIQTQLSVQLDFIDIESRQSLDSFVIDFIHTGGSRAKSRTKILEQFKNTMRLELKKVYRLSSDLVSADNGKLVLSLGTNTGIYKGMLFELVEPDRIKTLTDKEIFVPGGRAGFVAVTDPLKETCHSKILRQWRPLSPGSWAVEYPESIRALQLFYVPPSTNTFTSFGFLFHGGPIQTYDWGGGMQIIRVIDSFEEKVYGLGLSGFGIWRFLNSSRLRLGGKFGLDLDIPFKKDDEGQTVNTLLFSAHLGITTEVLLSARSDIIITAGYRIARKSSKWSYSEDDDTNPAVWYNGSPEVDNSGFLLSVGYKFFLF